MEQTYAIRSSSSGSGDAVLERDSSDAKLLADYASTESADAFTQIVERHSGMVFATCLAILRDRHAAEDATQSVFLLLVRKARGLAAGTDIAGWLHLCARSCAREVLR